MGIRAIKLDEVQEIMGRIIGSGILQKKNPDQVNEVRLALNVVLLANRNAVLFSYGQIPEEMFGDDLPFREINLFKVNGKPSHPEELCRDLENLLHNCFSDGGTDFMPARYRNVIKNLLRQLKRSQP